MKASFALPELTPYGQYQQSDRWKELRAERLRIDGFRCQRCGKEKQLRVHHVHYPDDRIYGTESVDDLVTLCDSCHKKLHEAGNAARMAWARCKPSGYGIEQNAIDWVFAWWAIRYDVIFGGSLNLLNKQDDRTRSLLDDFRDEFSIPENVRISNSVVSKFIQLFADKEIDDRIRHGMNGAAIARDLNISQNRVYKRMKKIRELGACMKKLDLSNVEAMEPNERERIEAGGYVVRIIDIDDHEDREFLWMVFDIAEGAHKDFYTKDANKEYYADKPNKHGILFSYKSTLSDAAKRMLKGKLKLFTDSNPGFDAESAWNACKPEMFIGRTIGIVAGCEEYVYEGRDDGQWHKGESIDWFHARLKKPDDIRSGKFTVPDLIQLNDDDKAKLALAESGASISASDIYDDIPFN